MKIYKHDVYKDYLLLAFPTRTRGCYYGVPYYYSDYTKSWERSRGGSSLPYYYEHQLKRLEYVGDTDVDWTYNSGGMHSSVDSSYLKKRETK